MTRRGVLAWVAVALAALGLIVFSSWPEAPDDVPPGSTAPPAPGDAAVLPAPAADASAPAAPIGPVTFDDGFCSPTGVESFSARYSLGRLVLDEVHRRLTTDAGLPWQSDTRLLAKALDDGSPAELAALAQQAAARAPDSPWPQIVLAMAARQQGQTDEQVAALRRARRLLPRDPALGLAIAEATRDSGELDEAIEGLGVYLATDPLPSASRLRARLEVQRDIQRDYRRQRRDGITLLWPGGTLSERQADEFAVTVDRGLDEAAAFTGTQRRQRLTVVVYPTRSELLAVSCARSWTGGLYDGTLRVVAALTRDGFDWKALRHETLHAQLSPLAPLAPRWFHEGVAQAFAQQSAPRQQWGLMVRNHVWVPFTSLDGSFQIFGTDDAGLVYAQSFAMVELMRDLGGEGSISTALAAFQAHADTPTALARACGRAEVTGADLLAFLERRLAQRPP